MPASRELPQQIPPPGNSLDAKAPGWGQFSVQTYGRACVCVCVCGGGGGGLRMELIPA